LPAPPAAGFFFNPDVELLERWYQAAAYQPFFRAHAHIETKRREPWLFGEPHTSRMREAVRERYRLLPYLYTLFAEAALDGTPVMRPLWYEFPTDGGAFAEERAFMLGSALLVRVVAEAGATEAEVYLPGGKETLWYDAHTLAAVGEGGRAVRLPAPAEHIPVLQRGGTVVARKERLRRASAQMRDDPYTLLVAPDAAGAAAGELYVDDGESHGYEDGDFAWRAFALEREGKALRCAPSGARPAGAADAAARARAVGAAVERVVLLGVAKPPARVTITAAADGVARELTYTHDATARVLVLRKPGVPVSEDWLIELW
jgi:alpha 1,3-glucosidase